MVYQIAATYYFIAFVLIGLFLVPDQLSKRWEYTAGLVIWSIVPATIALILYAIWS
jgi:hypothetical protein